MAGVRPARFAHKRTVRFKPPDYDQDWDTKTILNSLDRLPDGELVAIVPLYGGKCFDITVRTPECATALATRGLEVDGATFPLTLLGSRSLHVSVFVSVEFPDELLLETLRRYGELKTDDIRRVYFKEEGLRHLENGARVVEFNRLNQNIPRQIVVGGIPIGFKYSGQPNTCFKCGSIDHLVRNCPKKRAPRSQMPDQTADARGEPPPREAARDENNDRNDEPVEHTAQEENPSDPNAMEAEPTPDNVSAPQMESQQTPELFTPSPSAASHTRSGKRKTDKDIASSSSDAKKANNQDSDDNPSQPSSFLKHFMRAMKKDCPARRILMSFLDAVTYYRCRGLYLIHKQGQFDEVKANHIRGLKDPEREAWKEAGEILPTDAFAALIGVIAASEKQNPVLFADLRVEEN